MKPSATPTVCALLLGVVAAQEILYCGPQVAPYQAVSYTCIDDLLCPVVAGMPYKKCGLSCYSDLQYNCTEEQILVELPQLETSYQVAVVRKDFEMIDGKIINAKKSKFVIGKEPDITCPLPDCKDFKNLTVFAGQKPGALPAKRVALDTVVPGGQQALIEPSGEFAYSIPHSAFNPNGAYEGPGLFRAYKDGEFVFTGGRGWRACLVDDSGTLQIVQQIPGYQPKGLCLDVKLVTKDPGVPGPYAWEY